ncbi:MAG: hypothetical protein OK457_05930, partial [Thaumarchaeota archaeon]|nr:hypothetical protein [Nitrososphaerota archaeon]
KVQKFSLWPLSILSALGLFVGAVLSAEIATYGMYLSLALVLLGSSLMLVYSIHREQTTKKKAVLETPFQVESDF